MLAELLNRLAYLFRRKRFDSELEKGNSRGTKPMVSDIRRST